MSKQTFKPTDDAGNLTVYVGAYVPHRLYQLLVEEAEQAGLSRSKMIGWALAERYMEQGSGGAEEQGIKEQEA
jgi:hypothetical protein